MIANCRRLEDLTIEFEISDRGKVESIAFNETTAALSWPLFFFSSV